MMKKPSDRNPKLAEELDSGLSFNGPGTELAACLEEREGQPRLHATAVEIKISAFYVFPNVSPSSGDPPRND
jgi:hypothetical protein